MNALKTMNAKDAKLSLAHFLVGFVAVLLGAVAGLLQGLNRAGLFEFPSWLGYYEVLTTHGVLLALVFTTVFIFGYFITGASNSMGGLTDGERKMTLIGFILMVTGVAMAASMILTKQASVLFTFYLPMKASPFFYLGLALVVVGTYFSGGGVMHRYFAWKKEHPGERTPLFGYMMVATLILWFIASIGVVTTVLLQMLPLSLGLVETVNIELSRTLFWYFGHPLVYFWLMPAYMLWYTTIPKIVGGKVFSDTLARFSFILFIIFSMPVGFHHQLTEPGIPNAWKYIQVVLTFMVVIPSLITAFSMFATFEMAGRAKGAKGLFGFWKKLPWGDVRFLATFIAMLFFIPGGIGGLINASYQLNTTVHNTLWVVGHFHITVGTPVVLTFFAAAYWLIPHVTGRKLTPFMNKVGVFQTIIWSIGMLLMSTAQHILGLFGAPRRTAYTTYGDHPTATQWFDNFLANHFTVAIGGTMLFVAAVLMVYMVFHLAFIAPKGETEYPMAEPAEDASTAPKIFENWKLWILVSATVILIAYTIPVIDMIMHAPPGSPGFKTW